MFGRTAVYFDYLESVHKMDFGAGMEKRSRRIMKRMPRFVKVLRKCQFFFIPLRLIVVPVVKLLSV